MWWTKSFFDTRNHRRIQQFGNIVLSHLNPWKCIDSWMGQMIRQESIISHGFKWRERGVAKLQDPPLLATEKLS